MNGRLPRVVLVCFLLLVTGIVSFTLGTAVKEVEPSAPTQTASIDIYRLYTAVNDAREEQGLKPLRLEPTLAESADDKCSDMVNNNYWAHTSPQGEAAEEVIKSHYGVYRFASENLARDYTNSRDVIGGWMKSESHRAAILDKDYTDVGYAVCGDSPNFMVVQHFGVK